VIGTNEANRVKEIKRKKVKSVEQSENEIVGEIKQIQQSF
jgi:hypothetical protein